MLRDFLARTLRGLNPSYFYRQLFFGALIGALWLWMVFKANMCWTFAFFVAPVGLLILFFMNRPRMSNMAEE